MKREGLLKKAAMPAVAAVMVLSAASAPAESYFTTYVTARGGYTLHLEETDVIPHEEVDANVKNITAENVGRDECYVRVRVISGAEVPVTYSGAGWSAGEDGYWYYSGVVAPGSSTGVLSAAIDLPTGTAEKPIPAGTTVNVVVVTESAKVLYDEAGAARPNGPGYMGWTLTAKEG